MQQNFEYLYINGLGDGKPNLRDGLAAARWSLSGIDLHFAEIDWFREGVNYANLLRETSDKAQELAENSDGVVIIGGSAGGSHAFNVFGRLKNEVNVCAVASHARLARGDYPEKHPNSMHRRAKMHKPNPAYLFSESVRWLELATMPILSPEDKAKMLILTQLTDFVVPWDTSLIKGVEHRRAPVFGHSGGYLATMFLRVGTIQDFASASLSSPLEQ